jgi:hypothetical protein
MSIFGKRKCIRLICSYLLASSRGIYLCVTCTQRVHNVYTTYTQRIHNVYTTCIRLICSNPLASSRGIYLCTERVYVLSAHICVHNVYTACTQRVHSVYTTCTQRVYVLFCSSSLLARAAPHNHTGGRVCGSGGVLAQPLLSPL